LVLRIEEQHPVLVHVDRAVVTESEACERDHTNLKFRWGERSYS
jgi:hypothetical protein